MPVAELDRSAESALQGVGDARAGEWRDQRDSTAFRFVHLRRRLSEREAATIVPAVLDVRTTPEGERRYRNMRPYLPVGWHEARGMV